MWEKNLAKIRSKTTKNLLRSLTKSERERKGWKSFEKVVWISQNTIFKKTGFTMFDWSKNRFDQLNQAEAHWIFLTRSKIRLDQSKFWKNSFLEKITWFLKAYLKALNIRYKNAWVWDEMLFQNTSFKPNFSKI